MRKIVILILSIFFLISLALALDYFNQPLRITFLNVGYADSTLIELPDDKVVLIDAGTSDSNETIRQFLTERGITQIDLAIVTHPHKNHFGGFLNLDDHLPINRVMINPDKRADDGYQEWIESLKQKNIEVIELKAGDTIDMGNRNIKLNVLHPDHLKYGVNGASLVVELLYRSFGCLLFSDVLLKEQDMLIEKYPYIRKMDVITVPHHGRDITDLFIENFQNKTFIISTGFFEPLPLDEERLSLLDGAVYRTDRGHVILETNGWQTKISYAKK